MPARAGSYLGEAGVATCMCGNVDSDGSALSCSYTWTDAVAQGALLSLGADRVGAPSRYSLMHTRGTENQRPLAIFIGAYIQA